MTEEANGAALADAASTAAPIATGDTMRADMEAIFARDNPQRDAAGRFAGTETQAEAAPSEAAPATEITDQPEAPAPETATPSIEAPSSWSADVKAKWATLPPDVQAYIAQREGEAHKAITSTGERLKGFEALDAVIGPRRDALKASWGNEAAAVEQLFQLSDFATRDPAGFVHWFAQQNRVDLSRLPAPATAPADPQVAALQTEVQTLKSSITQQHVEKMDADIRSFAEAKGADGNPLRPHFNDVRVEMGRLISAGLATSLDDAYEQATHINKDVRSKIEAEKAAATAKAEAERHAKQREAAAKAAAEAKRAAGVNVRAVGAVTGSPVRGQSMRETMEAVWRREQGAA